MEISVQKNHHRPNSAMPFREIPELAEKQIAKTKTQKPPPRHPWNSPANTSAGGSPRNSRISPLGKLIEKSRCKTKL